MTNYRAHKNSVIVKSDDEHPFSDLATIVGMGDDGGGIYLTVTQVPNSGAQTIRIDPNNGELEAIITALHEMSRGAKLIGDQFKGEQ